LPDNTLVRPKTLITSCVQLTRFEDVSGYWLRWCDDAGNWFLTDTEQAEAQLLQAARNLLATGMEIAQVATILGLSEAQVQALESSR
jgi:hypothetical protein